MFHCKRQQYVSEAVGMSYYTLEKTVFSFKVHSPQRHKRTKSLYQLWVMLQKMMLWNKFVLRKSLEESVPMLRNLSVKETNS